MVLHFADLFHDLASFCSPADHHASSFVDPKVQAARRAANKDVTDLNKLKEATKGELEERMAQAQENKKTLKNLADNTVRVAQMIRDKVDGFENALEKGPNAALPLSTKFMAHLMKQKAATARGAADKLPDVIYNNASATWLDLKNSQERIPQMRRSVSVLLREAVDFKASEGAGGNVKIDVASIPLDLLAFAAPSLLPFDLCRKGPSTTTEFV
eukprot:GEMP01045016.1.p1 GENE.GEMP01045016.1~~GEMP01045016.1.p1  ORF type:complete len:214 (+),score=60.88 GEMP01045016.1:236-877(+)